MTKRLYDEDSYMTSFKAKIISCEKKGDRYSAVLDRTAFFPESGGQTPDTGRIGCAVVSDVQITGEVIYHTVDIPLDTDAVYNCEIDWEPRLRKMQNHSGEHLVSGLVNRIYGYNNVGFHLNSDYCTFDFDGVLTREQLREIEYMANMAVAENRFIISEYPSQDKLAEMEYRSKLDLSGNVRIVTIEGYDKCACCAPQVKSTGQIGMVKLLDFLRLRNGVRIYIRCGLDALDDYNQKYDNILSISAQLSAKQHETAKAVEKLCLELDKHKYAAEQALIRYVTLRVSLLVPTDGNLCVFEEGLSDDALRALVNGMTEKCGKMACAFMKKPDGSYSYIIGSKSVPLRGKAKEINSALNGKGGGRDDMIQGSLSCERRAIEDYFLS